MNQILAKRYAFCDFSSIIGFPNQVPARDEWENSLPRFRGEEWEVPAEHLLDFHDYMHRLQVVHEDVQIRLFCFSLEGIARDWYRSLPNASVSSLADFHAAFHLFCKEIYSADLLYPKCCHDFNLLNKKPDSYVKYATAGDASHHDQDSDDLQEDGHSIDALNCTPNASTILDCYQDHIASFEKLKDDEQIESSTGESIGATVDAEGSPYLSDLLKKTDCSLQVQDLQRLEICSRREEEQKELDQLYIMHVSLIEDEQFVVDMEIGGSHQQQHVNLQLEQLLKEVFHSDFYDPITDFLESMSSINIKTFLSDKEQSCFCYRLYFCMIRIPSFVGSRSRSISGNHFLTWLHWKHDFT
jgi:hypothetical protein